MLVASSIAMPNWNCSTQSIGLTFGGNIIETGTDSYRLAQTRAKAGG